MTTTKVFQFRRRTSFYLFSIPAVGAAAVLTYHHHTLNPDRHSPLHYITTLFNGVLRSSRSLYTITANVVDYKYSLQGISPDTDQYRTILSQVHLRSAKRILKLCEINQGFYIKAGQFVASMRQVPKEYSSTLASLQDQAVPCSFEAIKEVLISNLGSDLKEIFLSIDEQPIAAASIAQVHRALLKDHQEVVLKVQYPGLKDRMRMDIATMSLLAKCVTWIQKHDCSGKLGISLQLPDFAVTVTSNVMVHIPDSGLFQVGVEVAVRVEMAAGDDETRFFPEYRFQWMVSEFSEVIALELDFIQEARNSVRTAINFKQSSRIKVPMVFQVEETSDDEGPFGIYIEIEVDDLDYIWKMKIDPRKVAKVLVEAFAEMIFVHGFVHGDPHPGNILVALDEREGFCLVVLDHGIYRSLDEEFRVKYCQLWKALIALDSHKIQEIGEEFGIGKYARYLPLIFTGRTIDSKAGLGQGMSVEEKANLKQEVKRLSIGDISEFMECLPPEFLTVLRTESLSSKLGSPQRVRLLVYAHYALEGLSSKPNPDSGLLQGLCWVEDRRQGLVTWSKQVISAINTYLLALYLTPAASHHHLN
ncbi:Protein kinase-like domain-containing protein [Cynara cardunculus var. scolymus]|uniref:Protein kinase-like domain-containing protein n=1 Tax=Cynara cardunculus var. scolymus TaxID=59895 RepID=A0A103XK35_CYNCS|nr:Protein kinase-like domain-containing protein [Cynara cardunculus var. scolymus]